MRVKLDLETLTCDLVDVDYVELTLIQDALATYLESLYPEVLEALRDGASLDDALERVDEEDAFRIRVLVERVYDKLEQPLAVMEAEAEMRDDEPPARVRIVLDSDQEARMLHEAAESLHSHVERALSASDLPYPAADELVKEFAGWFDPDDIPEYPYYIEMDIADARIIAQLAQRVQAFAPSDHMEQLLKVMQAASEAASDEDEEDDEDEA